MKKKLLPDFLNPQRGSDSAGFPFVKALLVAAIAIPGLAQAQSTPVFKQWPLKANSQDSAAVRTANVTASSATLKRFVIGDGVTIRPYSSFYGQSFAPQTAGAGWGTSATPPGPGGSVKRTFYEQFTATAVAGSTVRADSVILTAGFLTTASSTNLAVVYSLSNFVSDSTDVTGGKGPGGPLAAPITGGFANPIALSQVSTGSSNSLTYRLALNGATGVTVNAGQTLTFRVYVSCSSTGTSARYALLKNVTLKSQQAALSTAASKAKTTLNVYPNPATNGVAVAHPAAQRGATVNVYSNTGQKVATTATLPGTLSTPVSLNKLAAGIYLVEYVDGQERNISRIVKQ